MDCIVHGSQRVGHNWATFTFRNHRDIAEKTYMGLTLQGLTHSVVEETDKMSQILPCDAEVWKSPRPFVPAWFKLMAPKPDTSVLSLDNSCLLWSFRCNIWNEAEFDMTWPEYTVTVLGWEPVSRIFRHVSFLVLPLPSPVALGRGPVRSSLCVLIISSTKGGWRAGSVDSSIFSQGCVRVKWDSLCEMLRTVPGAYWVRAWTVCLVFMARVNVMMAAVTGTAWSPVVKTLSSQRRVMGLIPG